MSSQSCWWVSSLAHQITCTRWQAHIMLLKMQRWPQLSQDSGSTTPLQPIWASKGRCHGRRYALDSLFFKQFGDEYVLKSWLLAETPKPKQMAKQHVWLKTTFWNHPPEAAAYPFRAAQTRPQSAWTPPASPAHPSEWCYLPLRASHTIKTVNMQWWRHWKPSSGTSPANSFG